MAQLVAIMVPETATHSGAGKALGCGGNCGCGCGGEDANGDRVPSGLNYYVAAGMVAMVALGAWASVRRR